MTSVMPFSVSGALLLRLGRESKKQAVARL